MRAGRLDKRVQLQQPTTATNGVADAVQTFVTYASVWASVEDTRGREFMNNQQVQNQVSTRIRLRYRDDVKPDHRVLYDGVVYDIQSVVNPMKRGDGLQLMCIRREFHNV